MTQMTVIDKDAKTWFVNTAAFRLPSPDGHIFEPGVKYKIHSTPWIEGQPTIEATDVDEDVSEKLRKPKQTRDVQIGAKPEVEGEK